MRSDSHDPLLMLESLVREQEIVSQERERVKNRIAKLQGTDSILRSRYISLENAIHEARVRGGNTTLPTSARPSAKNLGFLRSWMALRQAIATADDSCGLSHQVATRVITQAVPGIRDATIRCHLHRLRKRGFVEKVGNHWRLTPKGARNVDHEVD
jgi:hypothetical protein